MAEKEYKDGSYCSFYGAYAKIYTLADSDGNVFYVGCTTDLERRISGHLVEAKCDGKMTNHRKNEIIRSLNYQVVVKIVDMLWVTGSKQYRLVHRAKTLEKTWIRKFIDLGYDLCNRRIGLVSSPKTEKQYVGQTFHTERINESEIRIKEASVELENHKENTQVPIMQVPDK